MQKYTCIWSLTSSSLCLRPPNMVEDESCTGSARYCKAGASQDGVRLMTALPQQSLHAPSTPCVAFRLSYLRPARKKLPSGSRDSGQAEAAPMQAPLS